MDYKPPNGDLQIIKMMLEWAWALFVMPLIWCVNQIQKLKESALKTDTANFKTFVSREDYQAEMKRMENQINRVTHTVDEKLDKILDRLENKVDK